MNEADARRVLRVMAQESAPAGSPLWTDADRDWATQAALQEVGADAPGEAFLAARARHAMHRLAARGVREPFVFRRGWLLLALAVGFAFGAAADALAPGERIVNLLAPPVWAVLAWNAAVYLLLLATLLAPGRTARHGHGLLQRLLARAGALAGDSAEVHAAAARLRVGAPLDAARAGLLMHAAAAALALGLLASMYLRALVFDYRAGWQSTFLDGAAVHAWLTTLLAPASALSGVALPDAAALQAMQVVPGRPASASAAPWIHLYAVTLVLVVVLPRSLLALAQGLRAARLARRVELDLAQPYFQRLLRQQRGGRADVEVRPHAAAPTPAAVLGLRALLAGAFGDTLQLAVAPPAPFGDEESVAPARSGAAATLALFDLTATPETEQQGRFLQALVASAPGAPPLLLLVDEAGFRARFGTASTRHTERRAAWKRFAESIGRPIVFADLEHGQPAAALPALEAALRQASA